MNFDYTPPAVGDIILEIVTPTHNRPSDLLDQAVRIAPMLGLNDRWIVVDDASARGTDVTELWDAMQESVGGMFPSQVDGGPLLHLLMSYAKGKKKHTVNRARAAGCHMARKVSWIVEIDDHDILSPDAIPAIRQGIVDGYAFLYGDTQNVGPGGVLGEPLRKPDYEPWMVRDRGCLGNGVRAFPKWLYERVGGYRWDGVKGELDGNEFPGGDAMLQLRMESVLGGEGFGRIPIVLCHVVVCPDSLTLGLATDQGKMLERGQEASRNGTLI